MKYTPSLFIITACWVFGTHSKVAPEQVLVTLDSRQIKGSRNETQSSGTNYYHFQGIAYANPPLGDLRFEPPEPFEWKGTYDATYQRNKCLQNQFPGSKNPEGSEDCLYLNVYTPSVSPSFPLAVLVWIYGGAFLSGDGNYESYPPDNFIDQNLVVVSFNYRLGVFGFLTTGDEVVPGNMGLKDQVMALKWVQNNIKYFGGDPTKVTIMGESAGAGSVTYLVQSPATKGLFQRAIAHSGNALCPWSLSRRGAASTHLLGSKNKIFSSNTSDIIEKLKKVNNKTLLYTATEIMDIFLKDDVFNGLLYTPVTEVPNKSLLFSTDTYEQLSSCNLTSVPLIIGYNAAEVPFLLMVYRPRSELQPAESIPLDMYVNTTEEKNKVWQEINETYFADTELPATSSGYDKYVTDNQFIKATVQYGKLYSACEENVFLYRFSYFPNGATGVSHADELQYFFYNKSLSEDQKKISSKVVALWSNFIKTGNPTPRSNEIDFTWISTAEEDDYSFLDIGKEFINNNQSTNPDKLYLDKWTYWYETYGNRPFDTY